ncbi:unnamed protein product [Cunninghamella echinulata]
MAKDIISIYNDIKHIYKDYNLKLTAGGLTDVKGINTSDVDISLYHTDYNHLDHVFKPSTKHYYPNENATIYSLLGYPREVNIYATNDIQRVNMAMKHRQNELILNHYPNLLSAAIILKKLGESTESAWAKVLELKGDPFEAMARDDIETIAKIQEDKVSYISK